MDIPGERDSGSGNPAGNPAGTSERLTLRLYVAGQAPNSVRALANLDTIRRQCGPEQVDLEIVDVLLEPFRALNDRILVTPTLVRLAPLPVVRIAGDLSRQVEVRHALGLTLLENDTEDLVSE